MESGISGPTGEVLISHGFRALMRRVEWRGRVAPSGALGWYGVSRWDMGRGRCEGFGNSSGRDGRDGLWWGSHPEGCSGLPGAAGSAGDGRLTGCSTGQGMRRQTGAPGRVGGLVGAIVLP